MAAPATVRSCSLDPQAASRRGRGRRRGRAHGAARRAARDAPERRARAEGGLLADVGGVRRGALRLPRARAARRGAIAPGRYARALAGAGRDRRSARRLREAGATAQPNAEVLRARFEFELEHGDARTARAAYDALRDHGFEEDFFGLDRIALFFAHPGAPWRWRDAPGLARPRRHRLPALPAARAVDPAGRLGRARRERGAAGPGGFTLRDAWTVSAVYLFAEMLSALALFGCWGGLRERPTTAASRATRRSAASPPSWACCWSSGAACSRCSRTAPGAGGGRSRTRRPRHRAARGCEPARVRDRLERADPSVEEMVRAVDTSYGLGASLALIAGPRPARRRAPVPRRVPLGVRAPPLAGLGQLRPGHAVRDRPLPPDRDAVLLRAGPRRRLDDAPLGHASGRRWRSTRSATPPPAWPSPSASARGRSGRLHLPAAAFEREYRRRRPSAGRREA